MIIYSARSPEKGIPFEPYKKHISGVWNEATRYASEMIQYAAQDGDLLRQFVSNAALYHDLGKLCDENQRVLNVEKTNNALPVNHVDAGAALLLKKQSFHSSLLVYSHHKGLPNLCYEMNRQCDEWFRDDAIRHDVDNTLTELFKRHNNQTPDIEYTNAFNGLPQCDLNVFMRLALSCLVDADHTDSAIHRQQYPTNEYIPTLQAKERLKQLKQWAENKKHTAPATDRNQLRSEMFINCRDADIPYSTRIVSCDSPVGTGKTTAVMAHLLKQAEDRKLRRIFVILPFTNIIHQSVKQYRDILTLPGENPQEVVAELHHKADFESEDIRCLSAVWKSPIIVTTAVTFFETMASCKPASLRKLHELPGSAVFIDEAHAALPIQLWPITWRWLNILANEWNCYWVLASGSLCRFWEIAEIVKGIRIPVPSVTPDTMREQLSSFEKKRISFRYKSEAMTENELVDWVMSFSGTKILIMNTVQNAAVIARMISIDPRYGRQCVEHLSTALTPEDREKTLTRIKERLKDKADNNWILVATSCVEAGMDFSFQVGFREIASLSSLLQAAGRVSREGEFENAEMWSFSVVLGHLFNSTPGYENSSIILKSYLDKGISISPSLVTQSLKDEMNRFDRNVSDESLEDAEEASNFPKVSEKYLVINSDSKPAIVDSQFVNEIKYGKPDWRILQKKSVQVGWKLLKGNVDEIKPGLYYWKSGYDDFLGYMKGVLSAKIMDLSIM